MNNTHQTKSCEKCDVCGKIGDEVKFYSYNNFCTECYKKEKENFYLQKKKSFSVPSCDRITDKIFVGNSDSGRDKKFLKENNISHILMLGSFLIPYFQDEFEYLNVELEDTANEDISLFFLKCFKFIDSAHGNVLIHCHEGKSRSPALVIAFLMYKQKTPYSKCYCYVKSKRNVISINNEFKKILLLFEKYLQSRNHQLDENFHKDFVELSM